MAFLDRWRNGWLGLDYGVSQFIWEDPDVTISSKTAEARNAGKWWGKVGCKVLNVLFFTSDHCSGALVHDKERAEEAVKELDDETK